MRRRIFSTLILAAIPGVPRSNAAERSLTFAELPAAVQTAINKDYPGAHATHSSAETEKGVELFEVKLVNAGTPLEVTYKANGEQFAVEVPMAPADLPAAVKAALTNKYPGAVQKGAEEITKSGAKTYEIKLKPKSGKDLEVTIDAHGKVLEEE